MSTAPGLPSLLHLVNPVAERAILVGDPGRALELAQFLLDAPLMCNHQRGLWGYTGQASDGSALTIQSTGTGGPSAVAALGDLARAGVARVVRAGSAVPAGPAPPPTGAIRAVAFAVGGDGASRALGHAPGSHLTPDPSLLAGLRRGDAETVGVLSVDVLPQDGGTLPPLPDGVGAVDRQTAAVLAAAGRLGLRAAAVLAFPGAAGDEDHRTAWWRAVGGAAAAALGAAGPPPVPATSPSASPTASARPATPPTSA